MEEDAGFLFVNVEAGGAAPTATQLIAGYALQERSPARGAGDQGQNIGATLELPPVEPVIGHGSTDPRL